MFRAARGSVVPSASAVAVNVDPADGGSLAWKHVVCGLLVIFNCWGINLSFGCSKSAMSIGRPQLCQSRVVWIGSVQLALMFILAIPVRRAFDTSWCRAILIPGTVLMCRLILAKCLPEMVLFLAQGIMMGIGMGMVFMTATLRLTTYFKNSIGIAMSIDSAGSSMGDIVYTYVACQLLRHANFQTACLAMRGIMLGTIIPPCVVPWTCLPANKNRLLERRQATRAHYHVSRHVPDLHGLILWLLLCEYLNQNLALLIPEDMS